MTLRVMILNPPAFQGRRFVREGRCEQRLSSFQYVMLPISLPSIAAVLRQDGHEVSIVDATAQGLDLDEVKERIAGFDPALIIFNFSTVTFEGDKEIVEEIRKLTAVHLTAIGVHVTSLPEYTLEQTKLDSVVRGEPEAICLDLVKALRDGASLGGVKGLSYRNNGQVANNPPALFIEDLDSLPFPARDLLDNRLYTMPISNRPYTLMITSRGCPHRCIFCTARQYYGQRLRLRSAKNIGDELEEIQKLGIDDVTMWSDTFTINRQFVVDVCQEILRRDLQINWMANSRVDTVDEELLKLMKQSGCTVMSYGVESGVQQILDNVKKGTRLHQVEDAFDWTRRAGIETIAHVIFGLPGETRETIEQTISFVRRFKPDYAQFYCAIPFPGTEFYEQAQKEGWLITDDWSKFEINQAILESPLLSVEELKKARERAFRSFYFRPNYVVRRTLSVKSPAEFASLCRQGFVFLKDWVVTG